MRKLAVVIALSSMAIATPVFACSGPGHFVKIRPPNKPKATAVKPVPKVSPSKPNVQKPVDTAKSSDTAKKSATITSK